MTENENTSPTDDENEPRGLPEPPIHILSAFSTFVLDLIWTAPEVLLALQTAGLALIPASLIIGAINWIATTMVQKFVAKDTWGEAISKGFVLGLAAGVPTPVVGAVVGGGSALWSLAALMSGTRTTLPPPQASDRPAPPERQLDPPKPEPAPAPPPAVEPVVEPAPETPPPAPEENIQEGEIIDHPNE